MMTAKIFRRGGLKRTALAAALLGLGGAALLTSDVASDYLPRSAAAVSRKNAPTASADARIVYGWEKTNADIRVVGIGLRPSDDRPGAMLLARRAAVLDALRYLAEAVHGVSVNAETTVKDLIVQDDTVRTRVDALIKGAAIAEEGEKADGSYYVVMSLPLYGQNSLAAYSLPHVLPPAAMPFAAPHAAPSPAQKLYRGVSPFPSGSAAAANPAAAPAAKAAASAPRPAAFMVEPGKPCTGVIVDASGLNLAATFSPVLIDANGRGIYGIANIDSAYAIESGMVQYSKNLAASIAQSRAGKNPLIVRAEKTVRGVNCVISAADGDRILAAQAKDGMLNKCAVVFVR